MRMIMVNEDKRFCEMYWKNWNIGISNLTESNSYNFEYEKINTMFEMSLSSYVKWNDELRNSIVGSENRTHQDTNLRI
jgi:hypothetical protein|tara:strand:- start:314 stop:547 length:234 start_codon:yes stop_codon:yes gene_type:complete